MSKKKPGTAPPRPVDLPEDDVSHGVPAATAAPMTAPSAGASGPVASPGRIGPDDGSEDGSDDTADEAPPVLQRRPAIEYQSVPKNDLFLVKAFLAATPGLKTLQHYRRSWLRADLLAGVAVAAYMVPQCMAYSAMVGVPAVVGLWTALAALLTYAFMGGSRLLSVGPESTVALMVGTAIGPMSGGDPQRAIGLGAALSLIVAMWCFVARLARLGVIAELLSQPLLIGYLLGAAVLMVVGQLGKFTGTKVEGESIVLQLQSFFHVVGQAHRNTVLVGLATLVVIFAIHFLRHNWPAPLIAVTLATIAATVLHLKDFGVKVVGAVPTGLPFPAMPAVSWSDVETLLVAGIGVAIVAYGDNTLVARAFPAPLDEGEDRSVNAIDPQQELVALGGSHVLAGLFGGYPVSSSGSRTALAVASGARTQVYSLAAAACVVIVLFVAGPLVANLPSTSLAAVVIYAATKLVKVGELKRLAKFRRRELFLAAAATLGTMFFGILAGVGIAIALSVLEMAQRLARPNDGVLGRVPGVPGMHDVADYANAETLPGLVVFRYDAPLFFANVGDLQRRALRVVDQENAAFPETPTRWFILNVEANVEVDITAADGLRELHADLAGRGVRLGLARVKHTLFLALSRAGLTDLIGTDMLFPTLPVAEEAYLAWAAANPAARPKAIEAGPTPAPVPTWLPAEEHPLETSHHGSQVGHHGAAAARGVVPAGSGSGLAASEATAGASLVGQSSAAASTLVVHQPTSVIDPSDQA